MWGSYSNIPKAIFYLLKGDYDDDGLGLGLSGTYKIHDLQYSYLRLILGGGRRIFRSFREFV